MARNAHPNKDIESALKLAESRDWRVEIGGGHAWGKLLCPTNSKKCSCGEFCITSIWSTPGNPSNQARKLRRIVDKCIFDAAVDGGDK